MRATFLPGFTFSTATRAASQPLVMLDSSRTPRRKRAHRRTTWRRCGLVRAAREGLVDPGPAGSCRGWLVGGAGAPPRGQPRSSGAAVAGSARGRRSPLKHRMTTLQAFAGRRFRPATNLPATNLPATNLPAGTLAIGELAAHSGVATSALRYYEQLGLIRAERTSGNQRRYPRHALRAVAFVRAGRELGMPLAEIRATLGKLPVGKVPARAIGFGPPAACRRGSMSASPRSSG
jgi:DNA-binding transcriptional MerR regulator